MNHRFPSRSWGVVLGLGAVWGLAEAGLGLGLKSCASLASGSIMTAAALFFISAAWSRTGSMAAVPVLLLIGGGFKLFDAWLLSLPVRGGAVANPLFAFVAEAVAFVLVFSLGRAAWRSRPLGQALLGGGAALLAVGVFPLVRFFTGIAACVMPGTSTPLAWHFGPLAVGLSLLTVPLGVWAGKKLDLGRVRLGFLAVPGTIAACLALMVLLRLA